MNKFEFLNKDKSIIRHNLMPEMLIEVSGEIQINKFFYIKKIKKKNIFFSAEVENNYKNLSILKRASKWYHSQLNFKNMSQFMTNADNLLNITKFLLCLDKENKELYVLHREFPACLIYVEQTKNPVNFVVLDLYEENQDEAIEVLTSENFKNELREFFISQSFNQGDLN